MCSAARWQRLAVCLLAVCLLALTGCKNNPFLSPQARSWQQPTQQPEYVSQLRESHENTEKLNALNRDLTTQLAQAKQQERLARDQANLYKKQLAETVSELRKRNLAFEETQQRLKAHQASSARHGAATIRPNNSVTRRLETVNIPGYKVFTEGDVVRVEIPSNYLFDGGTSRLRQGAVAILDNVATALAQSYPRQKIVIEGHTDTRPGAVNAFRQTAAEIQAVLDELIRNGRLQSRQLSTFNAGGNAPRYSNATVGGQAANHRIEMVIYPDTIN